MSKFYKKLGFVSFFLGIIVLIVFKSCFLLKYFLSTFFIIAGFVLIFISKLKIWKE